MAGPNWNQAESDGGCSSCHQAPPAVDTNVPDIGKIYHSCAKKEYDSCCLKKAKADPKIVYSRNAQGLPTGYYCINQDHDACLKDTRLACSNQVNQTVTTFLNRNESPAVRACLSEAVRDQGTRLNAGVLDKVGSAVTNMMSDYYSDADVANKKKIQFELSYISSGEMISCLKTKSAQQMAPLLALRTETADLPRVVDNIKSERNSVQAGIRQSTAKRDEARAAAKAAGAMKDAAEAAAKAAKLAGDQQAAAQASAEAERQAAAEQNHNLSAEQAHAAVETGKAQDVQLEKKQNEASAKLDEATCADQATLDQLQAQCQSSTQDAQSSCDTQSNSALQNASALGDQLAASVQGAAATTGACSKVASYM